MRKAARLWGIFILISLALPVPARPAVDLEFVPAPPGSGEYMFSAIAAGPDGRIYMGTAPTDVSFAHLLRYDPASGRVEDLADFRKLTGENDSRLIPQSKIHTQLVFDKKGLLWFGTHCHERDTAQDGGLSRFPKGYSDGYCFSFDPKIALFDNRGILLPKKMEFPSSPLEYGESLISAAFDPGKGRWVTSSIGLWPHSDNIASHRTQWRSFSFMDGAAPLSLPGARRRSNLQEKNKKEIAVSLPLLAMTG
ncbi:MAG: hypothetical protein IT210_16965 [Armatimonadetes bacterium]|nr:hypothetical protein [Armatimonadota bacterium]